MDRKEKDFLEELREAFYMEAQEYIQTMTNGLISMEQSEDRAEDILENIYRAAHSLKGAARAVDMSSIGAICQSLEEVFSAAKRERISLGEYSYDVLQRSLDTIQRLIQEGEEVELPLSALLKELTDLAKGSPSTIKEEAVIIKKREETSEKKTLQSKVDSSKGHTSTLLKSTEDTTRISISKLDAIFLQMEEMITFKLVGEERVSLIEDILDYLESKGRDSKKRDYLSWEVLHHVERQLKELYKHLKDDTKTTALVIHHLLEDTKKLRMQPFSTLLALFPKMVRDLSREEKKEVEIQIEGQEIEVDRHILEQLKDPLIHLLRNAIDHGLEEQKERLEKKKPKKGTITLKIQQITGSRLQILFGDDGRGIDVEQLKKKALNLGIITRDEAENDDLSAENLIFHSGLTTSDRVTHISGRGLGMAIVKEAIEMMGGSISLENQPGEGTTFYLQIPSTLATVRGILFSEGGHHFVIPVSHVERVLRIPKERVKSLEDGYSITINDVSRSLVSLGDVLGLEKGTKISKDRDLLHAIILQSGENQMVFLVDEIIKEQEILVKGLGPQLQRVPNITGATVLGSGEVVPVLHVSDLMRSAISSRRHLLFDEENEDRKRILLVEDTITSRMLLTQILKQEGYMVKAVVNGEEAWRLLQESLFDLVISDVQMPEMDGFQLIEKIREDRNFLHLPVILVTSLESKKDREKGASVGADAYIVKSSFDQGNLLEVVRRLLGEG